MKSKEELRAPLKEWENSGHTDKRAALQLSLAAWQWVADRIRETKRPVFMVDWFIWLDHQFPDLEPHKVQKRVMPEEKDYLCIYAMNAGDKWPFCLKCPVDWEAEGGQAYKCHANEYYNIWRHETRHPQRWEVLLSAAEGIISCIRKSLTESENIL